MGIAALLVVRGVLLAGCAATPQQLGAETPENATADDGELSECAWNGPDGICSRECDIDDDCEGIRLAPPPEGHAAEATIVLLHGFFASQDRRGLGDVARALTADGHKVIAIDVPPFRPSKERVQKLVDKLSAEGPSAVHLIGHSMGGMDARLLVHALADTDIQVLSVTTISTPHYGSPIAEKMLGRGGGTGSLLETVRDLAPAIVEASRRDIEETLDQLTFAGAEEFNRQVPDDANVFYQSFAAVTDYTARPYDERTRRVCEDLVADHATADLGTVATMTDVASWPVGLILPFMPSKEAPSDGLVPVARAKWGVFRGCLPADHMDEVESGSWLDAANTGFYTIDFYRDLAFELAEIEPCIDEVACDRPGPYGRACYCP